MTQEQPSRFKRVRNWVDPRVKSEGMQLKHWFMTTSLGLVCGLIFGFLVAFGAFQGGRAAVNWTQRILAARAAAHIHGGTKIPAKQVYIAPSTGGRRLPASGAIYFKYFMGTTNQGYTLSCSAQGFAKALAYEWNRAHHAHITISPRQMYDIDTGGADIVTSVSDYNRIAASNGTVSTKVLNYGPNQHPSWISQWGTEYVPAFAQYGLRRASHASFLWYYQGAGYGAVQRAKEALYAHRVVSIGSDWYFNAEKSSWTTGKMGLPVYGDWVEYGHTVDLVRYNDHVKMPDGTTGAFLASNSFGKLYGRNKYGNIQRGHGGYVWLSYAYVGRYAAYGTVEDLGPARTGGGTVKYRPSPAPRYQPPFDPGYASGGGAYAWKVHNVHLYNNAADEDISSIINGIGTRLNVWPVAITSVIASESGFNPNAERWAGGLDNSCGLMQQIVTNVYLRIGYVGARAACNWEEVPINSIDFGVSILRDDQLQHPAVPWPYQDVLYNMGSGISDSTAFNPYGQGAINFDGNFLPNYRYALAYFMGAPASAAPPPPVFHLKRWCRWFTAHHKSGCPNPYWHKKLGTVGRFWSFTPGVDHRTGGVIGHEVWHQKRHFMATPFQHAILYSWPTHRGSRVKVALRRS